MYILHIKHLQSNRLEQNRIDTLYVTYEKTLFPYDFGQINFRYVWKNESIGKGEMNRQFKFNTFRRRIVEVYFLKKKKKSYDNFRPWA